jgi:hypothetical protein
MDVHFGIYCIAYLLRRVIHRYLSHKCTLTSNLGSLTSSPSGELLKGKDLQGSSKVALLFLGLDEPDQLGAGFVDIGRSFVGVSVNKCQSCTPKGNRVEVKDIHFPNDNLGPLGGASLEPLVLEQAGLSSLYAACYLFCKFFYLRFSYISP